MRTFLFISHQLHMFLEGRFFSSPALGLASRASFCRSTKMAERVNFSLDFASFAHVFGGSIFFIPNFGGG